MRTTSRISPKVGMDKRKLDSFSKWNGSGLFALEIRVCLYMSRQLLRITDLLSSAECQHYTCSQCKIGPARGYFGFICTGAIQVTGVQKWNISCWVHLFCCYTDGIQDGSGSCGGNFPSNESYSRGLIGFLFPAI